ncbi:hypothetical protein C366_06549 [Cryptococcus neoformans Tu401-1]|nr:hypothetical protein C366_06549 [Cryptococcus neoformans var. grubii Tu401-1]OXM75979.1 hypothetical protein C364_06532 [Cryptococcus neoformans var. grubii Bt63]
MKGPDPQILFSSFLQISSIREYCYSLARAGCSAPPTNGCRVFQREHSRRGREAEEAEVGGKWGAPRTRSHESNVGAAPAKKTKATSTKEHLHNPFDTPSQVLALENIRNFTREAAGAGVVPGNSKAGPLKAMRTDLLCI